MILRFIRPFWMSVALLFTLSLLMTVKWVQAEPCGYGCDRIPEAEEVLSTLGQPGRATLPAGVIKILAWNLHKGVDPEFRQAFRSLSAGKDIVMVSEATLGGEVQAAFEAMPRCGWNMATSFIMSGGIPTGVAIGSAVKPTQVSYRRSEDVEPLIFTPKMAIIEKFKLPSRSKDQSELLVISIHGINFADDAALDRQVLDINVATRDHKGPIVFAGDFNTRNEYRIKSVQQYMQVAGLTRVHWENSGINPGFGYQLDDAFTRGVTVRRAYLNNDFVDTGSDHPAIELEVIPE